ncbi:MAG: DNA-3-methyladenine glycosylase I [Aeromonas sp.]
MQSAQNGPVRLQCAWVTNDAQYIQYHASQWGRPEYASRALFAKLCLDGQQAGLSWLTILRRREALYQAYAEFDPVRLAAFTAADVARLRQDSRIIRHQGKIEAMIGNARAYLALEAQGIDFSAWLWRFVNGAPVDGKRQHAAEIPPHTPAAVAMAKALKQQGFKFVGPTICYAFMQAVGMVNDHLLSCPCHAKCQTLARPVADTGEKSAG